MAADGVRERGDTVLSSVQTFQIASRGTVKTVKSADLDKDYRVGDEIDLDGQRWLIRGVEMLSPRRPSDLVGLVVKPVEASS